MPIRTPATNQFRFRREQCRSLEFPAAVFLTTELKAPKTICRRCSKSFNSSGRICNLSAAQSDFASLQSLEPQGNSNSSSQVSSPISQAFNQLSQDLQSGNLSGAQQDYATLQQDVEGKVEQGHHHHHHDGGGSQGSAISQAFQQLGQALQSGNLTSAQQAYSTLQQDLPQFGQTSAQTSAQQTQSSSQSSSNGVSVTA